MTLSIVGLDYLQKLRALQKDFLMTNILGFVIIAFLVGSKKLSVNWKNNRILGAMYEGELKSRYISLLEKDYLYYLVIHNPMTGTPISMTLI